MDHLVKFKEILGKNPLSISKSYKVLEKKRTYN